MRTFHSLGHPKMSLQKEGINLERLTLQFKWREKEREKEREREKVREITQLSNKE